MGAEANGEEALDATSQNEEGQEGALPVTEAATAAETNPVGAGDAAADLDEPGSVEKVGVMPALG